MFKLWDIKNQLEYCHNQHFLAVTYLKNENRFKKKNTVALQRVFSNSRTTAVDKNPWGTDVMQRNICVLQLKFDITLLSLHMQKGSGKTTGTTVQNCKCHGERS